MDDMILRGDVYYADLRHAFGSEQGGLRPVLILQSDILNLNSPTAIVAPITSHIKHQQLRSHCILRANCPLPMRSMVLTEQLRTIDRRRLGGYVGTLAPEDLRDVEFSLKFSLELE